MRLGLEPLSFACGVLISVFVELSDDIPRGDPLNQGKILDHLRRAADPVALSMLVAAGIGKLIGMAVYRLRMSALENAAETRKWPAWAKQT